MFIHIASETFDPEKSFGNVTLHQTTLYKEWNEKYGRKVIRIIAETVDGKEVAFVQCVEHKLPIIGSFWTAYGGPVGGFKSLEQEEVFYKELKSECIKCSPKTVFIRIQGKPFSRYIRTRKSENTIAYFAPANEERIIKCDEAIEDVVDSFESVSLKKIIKALEKGASIDRFHIERKNFISYFEEVYNLLQNTSGTQKIFLQPKEWYYSLFEVLQSRQGKASLVLGYVGDNRKPSSFAITSYSQNAGELLLFGSEDDAFQTCIPSLCVYTSIKESIDQGMLTYNLGETSPDYRLLNRSFYEFTDQFGGRVFTIGHPQDIVIKFFPYMVFRIIRMKAFIVAYNFFSYWYKRIEVEIRAQNRGLT